MITQADSRDQRLRKSLDSGPAGLRGQAYETPPERRRAEL